MTTTDREAGGRAAVPVGTEIPAVVLQLTANSLPYGALGAIRTLGRLGVTVISARCAEATRLRSRYLADSILVPGGGAELTSALVALSERYPERRPVLLATDDVGALYLDHAAGDLASFFRIPASPGGLARALSDKGELAALCAAHGIAAPRTVSPRDPLELEAVLEQFTYPIVVKSVDPEILASTPGQRSVTIAESADAVRALFPPPPWRASNLLLQEYLPGDATTVWMFNGYIGTSGAMLAGFTGQKLRQHPIDTGCTALGVCSPNAEVHGLAERFLTAVGYRGIVDMGFRFDARDRSYRLLDVNPRLGATFRLFLGDDGIDVVRAMYLDLTGQAVVAAPGRAGRRWMVEPLDASSAFRLWRRGQLSVASWLSSLRGVEEVAWFAPDDLRPGLAMVATLVGDLLRRLPALRRREATAFRSAGTLPLGDAA